MSVGVLAVLTGLLLPAVQSARHAAARVESANQLRQLCLGTLQFTSSHDGRLPSVDGTTPNTWESVHASVLRYIDTPGGNTTYMLDGLRLWYPRVYRDPLDPTPVEPTGEGNTSTAANALLFRGGLKVEVIPDGSSNTVAFTTRYAQCGRTGAVWSLQAVNNCTAARPCPQPGGRPATFAHAPYGDVVPAAARGFQVRPAAGDCDHRVPQALSPAGLLVGLADGHVRWLRPGVEPAQFWAAVSPAGGESVGLD